MQIAEKIDIRARRPTSDFGCGRRGNLRHRLPVLGWQFLGDERSLERVNTSLSHVCCNLNCFPSNPPQVRLQPCPTQTERRALIGLSGAG